MGRKGGLAVNDKSGEDAACDKHIEIDEEISRPSPSSVFGCFTHYMILYSPPSINVTPISVNHL